MRKYWKMVGSRAWVETKAQIGSGDVPAMMFSIMSAALIVGGLWLFGSADGWRDELVAKGSTLMFLGVAFPLVYFWKFMNAPVALDRELNDRVSALEQQMKSNISLEFSESIHGCVEETRFNNGAKARFYRIKVKNLGRGGSNCDGYLVEVRKNDLPTTYATPLQLTWAPASANGPTKFISQDVPAFLDVGYISEDGKFGIATENFFIPLAIEGMFKEQAKYKFVVVVNDSFNSSQNIVIELTLGDSRENSFMTQIVSS